MSDTVYAIASGKGGVGKTTTAINLGAMLADRGHAVVVVDTDLGMANLAGFLDFDIEEPTLHEVLADEAAAEEAIYEAPGDIDVLPSATDIEAFAKSNPGNLRGVVADLREEYDYVLLDTGAGVSYDTLVPLALADAVLLVATPDVASVRDTAKTGELAERVETEVAGAVLAQRSSDILNADDVEDTLGTEVLAVVPSDEAVPMGIDAGRPLAAFAPNAPAGQAYRDLAAVVTGDAEPDPELELDDGDEGDAGERVEPEQLAAETEPRPGEDPLADAEIAENVRDAIEDGDSAGLLGGELANAAEELRGASPSRESAGEAGAREGGQGEKEPEREDRERDDWGDATESQAEDSTASEARSVDDLINEHISDDRLRGDADSFDSDDSDDPLAGMTSDFGGDDADDSEDDANSGSAGDDFLGERDGDDPLGGAEDPLTEGESGDAGDDSWEDEIGDWEQEARGEGRDGRPEEAKGKPGEVDDRRESAGDPEADEDSMAGSIPFENDRPDPADRGVAGSERADASGDDSDLDDPFEADDEEEDDSGGVLGRLGSLFK